MIQCRLLGPPALSVDGAIPPPELLWRKNLALLVYLARSPKRTRSREHLVGLLWADKPEDAARHSLREALRQIRRATGPDGLHTDQERVSLAPDAVELDTDRFEVLEAAEDWDGAAALVAGEFLDGFGVPDASAFEDWMTAERQGWRGRLVRTLTHAASGALGRGDAARAAELAGRATRLEPSDERATRVLMHGLALEGDRARALSAYERLAGHLAAHGTAPTADTVALAARIRDQREWRLDSSVPTDTTGGAELRRAPLVGRGQELSALAGVYGDVRSGGRAAACILLGDPGLGKSRLAEELAARARLDGATVCHLRAVEADVDMPWSGVLGLARSGLANAPGVAACPPDTLVAFASHLAEWADRFRAGARSDDPAEHGRDGDTRLGPALRNALRAAAEERPVVVVADDAHWMDRASLLTLTATVRDLAAQPFLLILTAQSAPGRTEVDELRSRIGRDLAGTTVRVGPLAAEDIRTLAEWALPDYEPNELDRVARRVALDSAGVPLLAVELLHAVALGLDLGAIAGTWPEPFHTLDQTLPGDLPDAIVAAVRVGFRRLTRDAQAVLAAAAVLDGPVEPGRIGRATELAPPGLDAALDELEWQRWLQADSRGYAFVARIVRDIVARDMVTDGQRRRFAERAMEER